LISAYTRRPTTSAHVPPGLAVSRGLVTDVRLSFYDQLGHKPRRYRIAKAVEQIVKCCGLRPDSDQAATLLLGRGLVVRDPHSVLERRAGEHVSDEEMVAPSDVPRCRDRAGTLDPAREREKALQVSPITHEVSLCVPDAQQARENRPSAGVIDRSSIGSWLRLNGRSRLRRMQSELKRQEPWRVPPDLESGHPDFDRARSAMATHREQDLGRSGTDFKSEFVAYSWKGVQ
jgi:hypothetical protein